MKEFYNFTESDAHAFAQFVGVNAKVIGGELVFRSCPYCKPNDKNTFSISLRSGQFQCKRASCGAKGNMITLMHDFNFSLGRDVDLYYKRERKNYVRMGKMKEVTPKDEAVDYMQRRGISQATTDKFHVTLKSDTDNIIVFPFVDTKNELICCKFRKIDFVKGVDKNKEWFMRDTEHILFGMQQAQEYDKPLVITEGQIDSMSLAEAGVPNAVSVPNGCNAFTWVPSCWDYIHQFTEVIVFGDNENGKITLSEEIGQRFRSLKVSVVQDRDYIGCKDANEILQKHGKEALLHAVENAKLIRTSKIISMSEVEAIDLQKLESVKTGFKRLDNALGHGIPFGSLVVVTGKRGEGKTTFVNQMVAEFLEQDIKCFEYSGELQNYVVKGWLDNQISGIKSLTNAQIQKINAWYKDKMFLYDNTMVDEEEEDVFQLAEEAILKFECRAIIIDNLMTAMNNVNCEQVYQQQGNFTRRLAKLAKRYNVVVILIAHPRKGNTVTDPDVIAGSGDIANAADIILSYVRHEKDQDDERHIELMKNRYNSGRRLMGANALKVIYSSDSMRIVPDGGCFADRRYSWNMTEEGFETAEDLEIPFD